MGKKCMTMETDEKCIQNIGWRIWRRKRLWEDNVYWKGSSRIRIGVCELD